MAANDRTKKQSDEDQPEPLKMTIYLTPGLVDALDAFKVQDQAAGKVSRHMSRPRYVQWVLEHYAAQRRR